MPRDAYHATHNIHFCAFWLIYGKMYSREIVSMLANFEKRAYNGTERVWTGRYRNLHNLPHWHLENELICVEQGKPPSP